MGEDMNDADRKLLTEKLLRECWHEIIHEQDRYWHWYCKICKKDFPNPEFRNAWKQRTFTTPADVFAVKDALVNKGLWGDFNDYCMDICPYTKIQDLTRLYGSGKEIVAKFNNWLFRPVNEKGKAHFCQLAADFLGKGVV